MGSWAAWAQVQRCQANYWNHLENNQTAWKETTKNTNEHHSNNTPQTHCQNGSKRQLGGQPGCCAQSLQVTAFAVSPQQPGRRTSSGWDGSRGWLVCCLDFGWQYSWVCRGEVLPGYRSQGSCSASLHRPGEHATNQPTKVRDKKAKPRTTNKKIALLRCSLCFFCACSPLLSAYRLHSWRNLPERPKNKVSRLTSQARLMKLDSFDHSIDTQHPASHNSPGPPSSANHSSPWSCKSMGYSPPNTCQWTAALVEQLFLVWTNQPTNPLGHQLPIASRFIKATSPKQVARSNWR